MTIFGVMSQNQDVVFFYAKLTYSKTFRAVFSKKGQKLGIPQGGYWQALYTKIAKNGDFCSFWGLKPNLNYIYHYKMITKVNIYCNPTIITDITLQKSQKSQDGAKKSQNEPKWAKITINEHFAKLFWIGSK